MQIQTTRFGVIPVTEADLIKFNDGILGFVDLKNFILLDDPKDEIFAWLQSCERPEIAFPVLEPELFMKEYKVNLSKNDLESLGTKAGEAFRVFNIVTIPEDATQMTANLKAPVVINVKLRKAKQVIVQENDYQIKFPIFMELQKRLVQNPNTALKSSSVGVGIKLPELSADL